MITRIKRRKEKPPYKIPSIEEINQIPYNKYKAISTFSGAGGSSLGYRMAGFKVLWANEFIKSAREVYSLNFPKTFIDPRDIRKIQPKEILRQINLEKGELDLLDGSPPCASFSTAGSREKDWGEVKKYSETKQRTDDLFFEFARIVSGLQPKVFIAENVSGLVKGVAKGYFIEILQELKSCGYNVKAKLLNAQWLGVPQSRQRIFFIGVRKDLNLEPAFPKPLQYFYSVRDAIPWIDKHETAPPHKDWVKSNRNIDKTMVSSLDKPSPTIVQSGPNKGAGIASINTRKFVEHIVEPECDISNYAISNEWDDIEQGESSEKYFSLKKPNINDPCPTITQTGRLTGAASVVHPLQKRKFSIAELKQICAFPSDFQLTGSYSQQWERLGRAVPPIIMFHIARVIRDEILFPLDKRKNWEHDLPYLIEGYQ